MSLINEALKKAQKQRTGEPEPLPAIGGESAARIARRGKPAGFTALIVRISVGVVVLCVIGVVTIVVLRRPPSAPAPAQPAPVAAAPVVQAPTPKPVEIVAQPATPPPALVVPATNNPPPVVIAAPVKPADPVIVTPVVAAPVITVPAAETPRVVAPGKLEPRAITFIESIRVAGIRASGSDRKVLMNDRVYRLGDLVEPEMGLTLVGIATTSLTFQDEKGGKYTRNF